MKTHLKVALAFCTSSILVTLFFGGFIYWFQYDYSYIDFYKRLDTRANLAAQKLLEKNKHSLFLNRDQFLERLENEKEYILPVNNGAQLAEQSERNEIPLSFLADLSFERASNYKEQGVFYSGKKVSHQGKVFAVVVSATNYYYTHHLSFLKKILLGGIIVSTIITVYFSFYFSKHIFDPIKRITDRVKQISTENMHLRLESSENSSEINELTSTFNDLLNRLETAFETQKNFVSNASHELATPLTSIIGEADVALIRERTVEEYRESIQSISLQAERLDNITKSLLSLAQTGYDGNKINFSVVRVDEIIWEVKEMTDKLNPDNKICVDSSLLPEEPTKLKVLANKQLLQLAFSNIVNNACKYSRNKPVWISLASSDDHIIVLIKDQGVGIPEEEISHIYEPFFRASNTHFFKGFGIGLPLARNIVLLHKGTIDVTSEVDQGTTIKVKLPLTAVPPFA